MNDLYPQYRKWPSNLPFQEKGVIVGADLTQEWLLPWWWKHYSSFNSIPVAFIDFGMSDDMKNWCRDHGELIPLFVADIFVKDKHEINPTLVEEMEKACGKSFWPYRSAWFKKPLACLQSPFVKTLWIDLDCQVLGPLQELFMFGDKESLAIAKDQAPHLLYPANYNSGVILFSYGLPLIEIWADQAFERNQEFRGDQDLLNWMIHEKKLKITEIPTIYNWSRFNEPNSKAMILHWHGPQGKYIISHQIMRMNL